MPIYRIFSNDRGTKNGVPLYSCLKEMRAKDAEAALRTIHPAFGEPPCAPLKAIGLPPTPEQREWLKRHVDA